jgi:long-subunit fatty acid transport protein
VLDEPHVGGIGFSGPTTGDLTAIYWNPAALGLLQGGQAMLGVAAQSSRFSVERAPLGARGFPAATGKASHTPLSWPPGRGTFVGVGAAIGNRFTLALAVYTPSFQQASYAPTPEGEQPTRYHAVEIDLRNVAMVPALAFRVGNDLRIGVAPGFLFSTGRLVFDEDLTYMEDPAAAARYDIGSGLGVFDSTLAFTVSGGLHYRRGSVSAGVAFSSRPLGNEAGGVEVNADHARVTAPGDAVVCPPELAGGCVSAHLRYDLPDTLIAGVTWRITPRTAVTGIFRWLTFSQHDRIALRVTGPASGGLRTAGVPERIVLHRGFEDVIEGRVRLEREMAPWLRLGVALRAETGAVSPSRLTAAAVDGPTLEPAAMAELRVGTWLRLAAGYAFTLMPATETGVSVFDPAAARACDEAQGDLANPACAARLAGSARPTAAGRYSMTRHTGTLTATFRF